MNKERIWYVYEISGGEQDTFKGYCVSDTEESAREFAEKTLGIPSAKIRVEDTGKTRNRCCPRR